MTTNNNRRAGLALDLYAAEFYCSKIRNCAHEGREFTLTLTEFKRLLRTKNCAYSGISMSHSGVGCSKADLRFTDLTLERVDNSKGYVSGNVKAVANGFNKMKALFENPNNPAEFKHLFKFAGSIRKQGVSK